MVLPVNAGFTEKGLKKRQSLQNGECGFPDSPIKYKRLKVSCIRDFPEGCGPCVIPTRAVVNSVDVLEDDSVEPLENVVESPVPEELEDLDQSKLVAESDDSGSEMVEEMTMVSSDNEEEALESDYLDSEMVEEKTMVSDDDEDNGEYGFPDSPIEYKRPKVSCIRDFSKGCGPCVIPTKAVVNSVDVLEDDSVEPLENVVESLVPEELEDLDQSKLVDESDDSGSEMVEEMTMVSSDNEEEALESDYLGSEMVEEKTMVSDDDDEGNDEYGFPDSPITYKRLKVSCIRDFPKGCGPCVILTKAVVNSVDVLEDDSVEPLENVVESLVPEELEDLDQFKLVDESDDSGFEMVQEMTMVSSDNEEEALDSDYLGSEMVEEKTMVSNDDEEEFDSGSEMVETTMVSSDNEEEELESDYLGSEMVEETTMVSSNDEEEFGLGSEMVQEKIMVSSYDEEEALDLVEPAGIELSKDLDSKLLQKDLVETPPETYLPRKRISAIRDFPTGCGSFISHVSKKNDVKQDKEEVQDEDECASKLNGMSSAEMLDDVQAQSVGDSNQLGNTKEKSNLSLKRTKRPKKINKRDVGDLDGKMGIEYVNKMEDRSLNTDVSCLHGNMNQLQGEKPIDYRVGRVIVQGLMAAPNCLWRFFKSTSTSGMARGK